MSAKICESAIPASRATATNVLCAMKELQLNPIGHTNDTGINGFVRSSGPSVPSNMYHGPLRNMAACGVWQRVQYGLIYNMAACAIRSTHNRGAFFSMHFFNIFGARRRRTPRPRAGLKIPADTSHRDLSRRHPPDPIQPLGVRRRRAPKSCLKIDTRGGSRHSIPCRACADRSRRRASTTARAPSWRQPRARWRSPTCGHV